MTTQNPLSALEEATAAAETSSARACLRRLFDEGSFVEIDRLARDGDGPAEAVAGYGTIDGAGAVAFCQDHDICRGAIGAAQAAKLLKVYESAAQNGLPLIGIYNSDGAKLGEGFETMDAIARLLAASNQLSGVVPQIAVVAGACVGSTALMAANADVVVAVDGSDYYLNPGDDNAAPAVQVADIDAALAAARALVSLLPANNLAAAVGYEFDNATMTACAGIDEVIGAVADEGSTLPLYEGDCATVLARVGGIPCGLVTLSGDAVSCDATARVARFVRLCDSFSLPVITFVDAAGFACLNGAAKVSHAYAEATTAKLTVIVGRAYGAIYIAAAGKAAGADLVLAWPQATILPLAPAAAVHLFQADRLKETEPTNREALYAAYAAEEGAALKAAAAGCVTDVVKPEETKAKLMAMLEWLAGKRVSRLPKKHSNIPL